MKFIAILSSILSLSLLQGCAGFLPIDTTAEQTTPKQSLTVEYVPPSMVLRQPAPVTNPVTKEESSKNLNEARIIKELNNAGCTISSFEMNRNKQNIRILCADSIQKSDFAI